MVFFILPVGSIIRAGRAISNSQKKASSAVDRAFTDSPDKPTPPPVATTTYTAPDGSAEVSKWKPRLIAREDGIEVDPRDVHLIGSVPPSPRTAIRTEDVELHEKKTDSAADTLPAATVAQSGSEPVFLYYRLLNADSTVFYSRRLKVGDNHPDIGCQLCVADEKEECPCLTSCGFDIRFDANINTITVVAPPSASAHLSPPPTQPSKGGLKGFMSNVARTVNETVLAERIQSQEIDIAYQQTEPRADHPPTHQVMDLNAVKPFHFHSEHHDCCCVLVYIHIVSKVQKNVGMQVVAMPKEEGDAMTNKCSWYTCTAC